MTTSKGRVNQGDYDRGYKQGQVDMKRAWSKWKFGDWFFKKQRKQLDEFLKDYDIDIKDIKFTPSPTSKGKKLKGKK